MAMTFYEKFKKYAPTDAERKILDHITAFTPKVDVEHRLISVYADFDAYIPPYQFESIEQSIKEAYDLNYMSLHPTYVGTEFELKHMDAVFYELAKLTARGLGFFNGAETALEGADITVGEDDTLHISLKNGGKELLLYTECDKLIADVRKAVEDRFLRRNQVKLRGLHSPAHAVYCAAFPRRNRRGKFGKSRRSLQFGRDWRSKARNRFDSRPNHGWRDVF